LSGKKKINKIKVPMYESEIEEIRQRNVRVFREVLERRLGKEQGKFLGDLVVGKDK
jgi:hypothetical protein